MNLSGNNWSELTSKVALAHNTSVNDTFGQTPNEIVFGTKPQVPMTLKLGLLQDKNKQCKTELCDGLQSHTHSENNLPNNSLSCLHLSQLSDELLKKRVRTNLQVNPSKMPSDNAEFTQKPKLIQTRTTYQRRTKSLRRKPRTG